MTRRKGIRPEQYAGIYKRMDEIPQRYRLKTFQSQYENKRTWTDYVKRVLRPNNSPLSGHFCKTIRLGGDSWLKHMATSRRHHALATPELVESWCKSLLRERNVRTVYEVYYIRIYQFYDYMVSVADHPHIYNPLIIAAIEHDYARSVWEYRIESRPEVKDRE